MENKCNIIAEVNLIKVNKAAKRYLLAFTTSLTFPFSWCNLKYFP